MNAKLNEKIVEKDAELETNLLKISEIRNENMAIEKENRKFEERLCEAIEENGK